jgi:hypothetical protein
MGATENAAMRAAGEKAHNAVKSLLAVVDNACKPGGGVKGDWTAQIAAAQTAADAAVDAFEAAITAT